MNTAIVNLITSVIIIIICISLITLCSKITTKNSKGCFGIRRINYKSKKEITMILNINLIVHFRVEKRKEVFKQQFCDYFTEMLEKNIEYNLITHDKIIEWLEELNNIEIISKEPYKERMIFEKIFLLNFKNYFKRKQFYKVTIKSLK